MAAQPLFWNVLAESIALLRRHPVLVFPKLLVAFVYGVTTLMAAALARELVGMLASPEALSGPARMYWLVFALAALALTLVNFFLDLFFSGVYPILVSQALHGRISFFKALHALRPRLATLAGTGVFVWALLMIVSLLLAGIFFAAGLSPATEFGALVLVFVFAFAFYFLYPVVALEKKGAWSSLRDTVNASLRHKEQVFLFSLIPFAVSLLKFALAFFSDGAWMLVAFWLLVLLTALVYTLHAVANQLVYARFRRKRN